MDIINAMLHHTHYKYALSSGLIIINMMNIVIYYKSNEHNITINLMNVILYYKLTFFIYVIVQYFIFIRVVFVGIL